MNTKTSYYLIESEETLFGLFTFREAIDFLTSCGQSRSSGRTTLSNVTRQKRDKTQLPLLNCWVEITKFSEEELEDDNEEME